MALSTLKTSTSEDELWQSSGTRNASVNVQKFPIRRLKPTIHKFQKVLQIDLERLQKHRNNIDKLTVLEDWVGLHKEQVNASRTVQQVKATLRDLERTRAQVFDVDLDQFDEQLQDAKILAVIAVENFLCFSQADSLQPEAFNHSGDVGTRESTSLPCILNSPRSPVRDLPYMQTQLEMHHVPDNSQAAASAEELLQDIQELNELVHQFANLVKGEAVDKIEDNLEMTSVNVREGTLSLAKASKYKMAAFPIVGAIVGAAVAGPVGLVAGAKIGGLAGAGLGGLAGLTGGSFLKHRHNKVLEMEMKNLEERSQERSRSPHRSNSTPELSVPLDRPPGTEDPQRGTQQASQSIFTNLFPWRLRQTQSQSDE